jgi:hypothetical protein
VLTEVFFENLLHVNVTLKFSKICADTDLKAGWNKTFLYHLKLAVSSRKGGKCPSG